MADRVELTCPCCGTQLVADADTGEILSEVRPRRPGASFEEAVSEVRGGAKRREDAFSKAFDRTRKQGFSVPLTRWLRGGEWRELFRAVLLDPQQRWFSHRVVENLLARESDRCSNAERLFGLVMFELWRREYGVDMGVQ